MTADLHATEFTLMCVHSDAERFLRMGGFSYEMGVDDAKTSGRTIGMHVVYEGGSTFLCIKHCMWSYLHIFCRGRSTVACEVGQVRVETEEAATATCQISHFCVFLR